jgi:RNA polymerase sigma-70 factor (ECF subfamily)
MELSAWAALWAALPEGERAGAERALARDAWPARLAALAAAGRAAWPRVSGDEGAFVRHLLSRVPVDLLATAPVEELRVGELYLAWACASGNDAAVAAFDRSCLAGLAAQLAAAGIRADLAGEAEQRTRVRLLVAGAGAGAIPKIADYRGRGELRAWTRTVAVREALQLLRQARKEGLAPAAAADEAVISRDPELVHLQTKYAGGFKEAFLEAFAALTPRERNILRQHLAFGMSCDQLAAIYSVHATTALRWSTKAREKLWDKTRRAVQRRFGLGAGDADSLIRALQERLHVTWERLLSGREL